MSAQPADVTQVTEAYYDSHDADQFYRIVWGGEDIHVGLYEPGETDITAASRRTVARMADHLIGMDASARVLDLGAGYGGAARYLAKRFGCPVTCLNLSKVENARNTDLNKEQGLDHLVEVVHGSFEDIPLPDASVQVIWSQDAILHSGNRAKVLEEAARVLAPGGQMIFTDPMQADQIENAAALQPIYDRIHLDSLASVRFYRDHLTRLGLEEVRVEDLTPHMRAHYAAVRSRLQQVYDEITRSVSKDYVDRMLDGLEKWVDGAQSGLMAWGILHFRKR